MTAASPFPEHFVWGAATSAYQVEGAVRDDGRGESIWDRFAATPGKIAMGDTGAIACDSYHRYREDVRLLRALGLNAYRFSIAWPRIVPEGRGRVNAAGLAYYDRLVDALLDDGIEPFATLYHWDLPQPLEDRGGWPVRDTAGAYAEYVQVVAERLGDRVRHWITQNEPWVASWLGYGLGEHAPGRTNDADAVAAAHHLLLAHGYAVDVLRSNVPRAKVGITIDLEPMHPLTTSPADVRAAADADARRNRWFLDPVLRGAYPSQPERYRSLLPEGADADLPVISAPLDFLGVNYYQRRIVRADGPTGETAVVQLEDVERTAQGWEVYPRGLHELLVRLEADYEIPPIYVTENGAAYRDSVVGGAVDDPERTSYLRRHLQAVAHAIADAVPVAGYFVWSLLDNFEWAHGYTQRFGIVHVDFDTLERVPKSSYAWYRDFIARQRATTTSRATRERARSLSIREH
jgi:beta-glucosidase